MEIGAVPVIRGIARFPRGQYYNQSMETCRMEFSGKLLKRGFWLYVWDIKEDRRRHIYVGRTGDSSSNFASSPFVRIGRHLDLRQSAKSNSLVRRLQEVNISPTECAFEFIAFGPLFPEQKTTTAHRRFRGLGSPGPRFGITRGRWRAATESGSAPAARRAFAGCVVRSRYGRRRPDHRAGRPAPRGRSTQGG